MKRFFRPFVLTMISATLVYSCSKKETVQYVRAENKELLNYKPGSYWILQDSATGRMDSLVSDSYNSTFSDRPHQIEAFQRHFDLYSSGKAPEQWIYCIRAGGEYEGMSMADPSNQLQHGIVSLPFKTSWTFSSGIHNYTFSLPTFQTAYLNEDSVYYTRSVYLGLDISSDIYYKKGIGILKLVRTKENETSVYNLVRWNIKK